MSTKQQAFLECYQDTNHDIRIISSKQLRKIDTPTVPLSCFQVNCSDIDLMKEFKYVVLDNDDIII